MKLIVLSEILTNVSDHLNIIPKAEKKKMAFKWINVCSAYIYIILYYTIYCIYCHLVARLIFATAMNKYNHFTSTSSAARTLQQQSPRQDSKRVLHLKIALYLVPSLNLSLGWSLLLSNLSWRTRRAWQTWFTLFS